MPVQVNVTAKVNRQSIRREQYNGRDHWVIPSYTLPFDVVMNGILYPRSEVERSYKGLDGTLAPLGHPQMNGAFVSAFSPEGINVGHVGAWNRNVKLSGNRVYAEKWIDLEVAGRTESGKRLLARLESMEKGEDVPPIHTSVAVFLERQEVEDSRREELGYDAVAKIHSMDHDAILLDEIGAATPEQGVGLMVNADDAKPVRVNTGALTGMSFRERESLLSRAAQARWATGTDQYVWIADFTETQAVVVQQGGNPTLYGYKIESGAARFDDTGVAVERQESWVARLPIVNRIISFFKNRQARPDFGPEEAPMTEEERAALLKAIGEQTTTIVSNAIAPIGVQVKALEDGHKVLTEHVTANSRAEETTKRAAVTEKFGAVVANALSGAALDEMFKKCAVAPALNAGDTKKPDLNGAPDPAEHFGGAK